MTNIKEMLHQISSYARLHVAMVAKIEELEMRVYALEENKKLKDTTIQNLSNELYAIKLGKNTGDEYFV